MRATLRRSCDSCAKAKHRCDLQTPRCSRCTRRKAQCVYVNEPLTSSSPDSSGTSNSPSQDDVEAALTTTHAPGLTALPSEPWVWLFDPANTAYDPFDSYPPTRLPRPHVQRLIHHFLSSIAFQYYPLDLSMKTNPFIVSWWPLALEDPALFHVSLQTASLDEELRAQRGFPVSEALMLDSVSELRKKMKNSASAVQDGTINAVVTLAAIEHGKGNFRSSTIHIDGVKKLISIRGGINQVKRTSPLTARMVVWVSMLVTSRPQFPVQEGHSTDSRDAIWPISQWHVTPTDLEVASQEIDGFDIDPSLCHILARLRNIFHGSQLATTEMHDLTSFVVHKLLSLHESGRDDDGNKPLAVSHCLQNGLVLYMLIIHGTTYYSHMHLASIFTKKLKSNIQNLALAGCFLESLRVWAISIGMASSFDPIDRQWFFMQACYARRSVGLTCWNDVMGHLRTILWLEKLPDSTFWSDWQEVFSVSN